MRPITAGGDPPSGTIRDRIERHARQTPDKVSHLFPDGSPDLTWSGLLEGAEAVAGSLTAAGAARCESVVSFLHNGRAAVLVLFGLFLGGFRATPLNLAAGADARGHALRHSGARFAIVDRDTAPHFDEAGASGISVIDANELAGSPPSSQAPLSADDEALRMYTSGTTGRPKGVLHSHRSLLAGGWTTACAHQLGPDDRGLCVLPHYHINGHVRGPGETGEIAVKGPNVMLGYLDDAEATRDTFTKDGWLKTGDVGSMDEDGYVHVSGRLKELIIKGGENIAPREVDEALDAHPDVIEAAAFARPCPDYGQRVEAAVCLAKDATVTTDELITHCRARLGAFRAPERIHVLADLPRGPSGKVQRARLAGML